MKLKLKDFRCYDDVSFDFGNGMVLLTGKSGQGKTSIFMAINFALFGVGTKIVSYGKTSCIVELEIDDLKIIRSRRPNRLVVNEIYEDDVGQDIINKKFGNTFDVTGYIAQNAVNSFVTMSPIDKLNFLEKFAFKDIDLTLIKKKCKDMINMRHENMISISSKLELATNMLKELKIPEEVKFPIKCSEKQQEKVIKNEDIKLKNCNILIKKSKFLIKKIQDELNDLNILENTLSINKNDIDELLLKFQTLSIEKQIIDYKGQDYLNFNKKKLEQIIVKKELTDLKISYSEDILKLNDMIEQEVKTLNIELESINNRLWKDYDKTEIQELIKDYKLTLKSIEKVSILKNNLKKYKIKDDDIDENTLKKITIELENKKTLIKKYEIQKEVYSCPSCKSKLKINNNNLCLIEDFDFDIEKIENINILKKEIIEITSKIKELNCVINSNKYNRDKKLEIEKEINDIISMYETFPTEEEITEDLEYIQKYNLENKTLEKRKEELENIIYKNLYSSSLKSFQNNCIQKSEKIKILESQLQDQDIDISENELRNIIETQEKYKSQYENIENNIKEIQNKNENKNRSINLAKANFIEKYGNIKDKELLLFQISDEEKNIKQLEEKKIIHEKNIITFEKYKKYKNDLENYNSWFEKLEQLKLEEKESKKLYLASLTFKEKISEAESISLLNIISSINIHIQTYLDYFFIDNPINIRLCSFKESKKNTKPQINVQIEYKGMECDLSSLSGGELSRVILAYTLGLSEIFNTPILLLDESTASLDQDITTIVFNTIKENFKGKLLLTISHNVIEGIFDKVIKL